MFIPLPATVDSKSLFKKATIFLSMVARLLFLGSLELFPLFCPSSGSSQNIPYVPAYDYSTLADPPIIPWYYNFFAIVLSMRRPNPEEL